ncbi:MAG: amino acid synthesis family protein [Nocardioides sp.]|uniref:amino acid synthesis family protein n=1 Tax=Nocardioides sp. TaxID=35761 RepID=UPI0039E397C1
MIRKVFTFVEETLIEGGQNVEGPCRAAVGAAIIDNPFAGGFTEDLTPLRAQYSKALAELLVPRALNAIGFGLDSIETACFGKAALVGLNGEIEHGSAIIHNMDFGGTVRDLLGGGDAMIPSVEKRGPAGSSLDIPLKNRHDAALAAFHQTVQIYVPDGPGADEILIAAGISLGPRPHPRIGVKEK